MLWRVHVELEDRPGRLGELATAVGAAGGGILALHELSRGAALLELAGQAALSGGGRPRPPRCCCCATGPRSGSARRRRRTPRSWSRCTPGARRRPAAPPAPDRAPRPAPGALGRLLGELGPAVLALTTDGGSAVGVGALEEAGAGAVRATVLVEDAWQGRGLGTALLRRTTELAVERGFAELAARVRPEDVRVTRLWRRAGLRPCAELVADALHGHAPLPAPAAVAG